MVAKLLVIDTLLIAFFNVNAIHGVIVKDEVLFSGNFQIDTFLWNSYQIKQSVQCIKELRPLEVQIRNG